MLDKIYQSNWACCSCDGWEDNLHLIKSFQSPVPVFYTDLMLFTNYKQTRYFLWYFYLFFFIKRKRSLICIFPFSQFNTATVIHSQNWVLISVWMGAEGSNSLLAFQRGNWRRLLCLSTIWSFEFLQISSLSFM